MVDHTLSMEYLRGLDQKPRVHGNGFIQLNLSDGMRLHIWGDPRIPRQRVATSIHEHVFGFVSNVLVGRMINLRYKQPVEAEYGDFQLYQAVDRKGEDTELQLFRDVCYDLDPDWFENVTPGNYYTMDAFDFHETLAPEPTATVMRKTIEYSATPRVAVPAYSAPDNDFDRYAYPEEMLWQIIEDVLGLAIR